MPCWRFESVSSWRQPVPPPASRARTELVATVARQIARLSPGRIRVAVDGLTGAGETSCGHELAASLGGLGRPTMRASLDDFKNPWRHAREHGYDRVSGEGYYRNACDFASARDLLLRPAGPDGSGDVVLCGHDPLTNEDHRDTKISAPPDPNLIVGSVFALRPQYNGYWEYRIWLEVEADIARRRGIARDAGLEGIEEAARLHRDRYGLAEESYLAEVCPGALADIIIDNTDIAHPHLIPDGRC